MDFSLELSGENKKLSGLRARPQHQQRSARLPPPPAALESVPNSPSSRIGGGSERKMSDDALSPKPAPTSLKIQIKRSSVNAGVNNNDDGDQATTTYTKDGVSSKRRKPARKVIPAADTQNTPATATAAASGGGQPRGAPPLNEYEREREVRRFIDLCKLPTNNFHTHILKFVLDVRRRLAPPSLFPLPPPPLHRSINIRRRSASSATSKRLRPCKYWRRRDG